MSKPRHKRILPRRVFLKGILSPVAIAAISPFCTLGCSSTEETGPLPPVELGPISEFRPGRTVLDLYRLLLLHEQTQEYSRFAAVSLTCTHMTCLIKTNTSGGFTCPCHGSRFSAEGKVLLGPAVEPLPWYALSLSEDRKLYVHRQEVVSPEWRLEVPI